MLAPRISPVTCKSSIKIEVVRFLGHFFMTNYTTKAEKVHGSMEASFNDPISSPLLNPSEDEGAEPLDLVVNQEITQSQERVEKRPSRERAETPEMEERAEKRQSKETRLHAANQANLTLKPDAGVQWLVSALCQEGLCNESSFVILGPSRSRISSNIFGGILMKLRNDFPYVFPPQFCH